MAAVLVTIFILNQLLNNGGDNLRVFCFQPSHVALQEDLDLAHCEITELRSTETALEKKIVLLKERVADMWVSGFKYRIFLGVGFLRYGHVSSWPKHSLCCNRVFEP